MKIVKVVAAIIRRKDKIFATQRGYGEFKGGWEFPGGKVEDGETSESALIRLLLGRNCFRGINIKRASGRKMAFKRRIR